MTMWIRIVAALLCLSAGLCADSRSFEVTAYCHCARCCGVAGGPTASGARPVQGVTVAAPRWVPFGTLVEIEGVGIRIVQDRLARRYDHRFDVFTTSHREARRFGVRKLTVRFLGPTLGSGLLAAN
jgi:3D (Asp-Asp-Asp) domain-containing protein